MGKAQCHEPLFAVKFRCRALKHAKIKIEIMFILYYTANAVLIGSPTTVAV